MFDPVTLGLAAAAIAAILVIAYLLLVGMDYAITFGGADPDDNPHDPGFWGFVLQDLGARRIRFVDRWRSRGRTWARVAWWIGVSFGGALVIGWWIGGVEYVQSWVASVFRGCSGAALGFLICRFVLRINVSDVADRYPAGSNAQAIGAGAACLACSITLGSAILAVALGM